ncbi:glycosyl hydrolase family 8 [Falsiroseomonas sp. E2-1-a4]|uniref:glycosyl hydrolase family 8 n=1 Tax=Falsiroseomonas sp. E2-1-a4 TaxID=3239299 RepID=UPI003F41A545
MLAESQMLQDAAETHDARLKLTPLARRTLLAAATAALVLTPACGESWAPNPVITTRDDPAAQWRAFRDRFMTPEGRVVDNGNGGISHSEGQGYAMLFAEAFEDRPAFERAYHWARTHLRRADGLYAWRYRPQAPNPVEDANNATDGDLYIAWALLRAADRWLEPAWRRDGQRMAQTILQKLVLEVDGRTVLLPGAFGFVHADRVVVNPSYYAFPALAALGRAVPDRAWGRLMDDGLQMMRGMRYGRWSLPADWVELGRGRAAGAMQPAQGWPARFSFDAVRVPLHLAWAGLTTEPCLRAATQFWNDPWMANRPAWADLRNGQLAPYAAPSGIEAVADVTTASGLNRAITRPLPGVDSARDYYSAALSLLSRLALRENPRMVLTAHANGAA